jgi:PAS domain S-box-containing protein
MTGMAGPDQKALRQGGLFLSMMPPTPRDNRLAAVLVVFSVLLFAAIVPFAKTPLTPIPGFIPAYQAILLFSDVATAVVLFGQYSIVRSRALLMLGSGYLFTALAIVPHTLSFPGLFSAGGLIGSGPQTTVWLYMLWHAGFPLFVMAYVVARDDVPSSTPARMAIAGTSALTALIVVGFVVLTTAGHDLLPVLLLPDNAYTPAMRFMVMAVWALNFLALLMVWRSRRRTALDLWLIVVMVAWTCDVGLGAALNYRRFDLGFYTGRAYGLAAACFVLFLLLVETRALYARLARALDQRAVTAERATLEGADTLRAVVDASSQAIVALAPDGNVLLWNKTAEIVFGYASFEVVGRPFPLAAPDEARHATLFTRAAGGETVRDEMMRCATKSGAVLDIRGSAAPFYDASGWLRGMVYAFDDVTRHARAAAASSV